MDTNYFPEGGGGECLKKWSTPQNSSKGRVKFWVTEEVKGGQKKVSTIEDHTENFASFLLYLGTF